VRGVILLAHGSRAAVDEANDFLNEAVAGVKKLLGTELVEPAWMNPKSCRQDLRRAAARLVAAGVRQVVVAPVFLTAGLHIRRDIPERVAELKRCYPEVEFVTTRHLGCDPRLVEVLHERIREAANWTS